MSDQISGGIRFAAIVEKSVDCSFIKVRKSDIPLIQADYSRM